MRQDPDPDSVIAMERVGMTRSGNELLREVTWRVELDERWVVLGPNGAGKTTLLSIAGAVLHPTTGTVDVLGERVGRTDVRELRSRIGLCTAAVADRIPPAERVRDLVMSAAWAVVGRFREGYDRLDRRRAEDLLTQLGMERLADRAFGTLSEGERKRVQIARALMTDPELLLLDEPAAGLDLGAREDLIARLATLAADPEAPAMVLVTHHVEEIPPGFGHALLLQGGGVIASGLTADTVTSESLSETFLTRLRVRYEDGRFTARAA